jgi:hypothetical protein
MPLEPVHVMEMDRSTSRLELVRINPTRQFLKGTDNGMSLYTWQNGDWYDTGGNPMSPDAVPAEFRAEIAANPVSVATAGAPMVAASCRICGDKMNTSEMEEHLLGHVHSVMQQAGAIQAATDAIPPPPPEPPSRLEERRRRPEN